MAKKQTNKISLYLGVFLVLLLAILYFRAQKVDASWFDDGWRYRVAIPISAHTAAETNVYLNLTGANGIDTTDTTKFQTDCGDVRFTTESGEILPYYLTTACGLAQTGFHVFLKYFPAGAQTIYYYYGNPGAPNVFVSSDFLTAASSVTLGTRGSEVNAPISPITLYRFDEGTGQTIYNTIETTRTGTLGPDATVTGTDPSWKAEESCLMGRCLQFTASSSQYVNVSGSVAGVKTVSFWVKPTTTTTSLAVLNGAAGNASISVSAGTISAGAGFSSPTIYVNGVQSSTLVANSWQLVTITTSSGITASNIMIGRVNTGYLDGFIDEFRIYGSALSVAQIKSIYASSVAAQANIKGASVNFGAVDDVAGLLTNGLVGWWKMDEVSGNAVDSSGNATTLTNTAVTPYEASSKFGRGADFESGSSQYESVADNTVLSITGSLSLAAWIKPETVSAGTYNILGKWDGANESYRLLQNGDEIRIEIDSAGNYVETTSFNLAAATWYHVVGVYDSVKQEAHVYINGTEATSTTTGTIPSSIGDDGGKFHIGAEDSTGGATGFYDGIVDEVRVYNRALVDSEIRALYMWEPGPFAHYDFDTNTGTPTTINDRSGNGYNGAMGGSMNAADWVPGKYGSALDFDGVNDVVNIYSSGFANSFNEKQGAITMWIKMPSVASWSDASSNRSAIQLAADSGSNFVRVMKSSSGSYISINYAGAGTVDGYNYTSTRTDWFYLAFVWDKVADEVRTYIDGVLVNTGTGLGVWSGALATTRANIGSRLANTDPFVGSIDNVKIYNYSISPRKVFADMEGGLSIPVAHWKFDEGSGTTGFDSTSPQNNLSLNSASWNLSGKFGKAWNGTGGDIRVSRSTDPDLEFAASEDFTISSWVKTDSTSNPAANEYVLANGGPNSNAGYAVYFNSSGYVCLGIDDDVSWGPDVSACSTVDYYDNTWHSIVGTRNVFLDKLFLYVDGVKVAESADTTTGSLDNSQTFYVGDIDTDNAGSGEEFAGDVDELMIFRSALNIDQVKLLLNNNMQSSLGVNTVSSANVADKSALGIYCVAGDSSSCLPPVGEWKMDENTGTTSTADSSGNNNSMSFMGSMLSSAWVTGKKGTAIKLDGVDDYLQASENSLYESDSFTLETWVNFSTLPSVTGESCALLVKAHPSSPYYSYSWTVTTSNALLLDWTNTTPTSFYSGSNATITNPNVWYHLVTVKNGTGVKHYVNGIDQTNYSDTMTGSTYNSSSYLWIGAGGAGTSQRCKATFDDTKVFGYARSLSQITLDYNRGEPIARYKLDECEGAVINDSMGRATTGSIVAGGAPNTSVGSCAVSDSATMWYDGLTGKNNYGLGFDGASDYVSLGSQSLLNTQYVSVALWTNLTNPTDGNSREFYNRTNSSNYGTVALRKNNSGDTYYFQLRLDGTESTIREVIGSVASSGWHFVVGTYDGATMKLYVDGSLVGSTSVSGTIDIDTLGAIDIGRNPSGINYMEGILDDISIYNYALTQAQVVAIMNSGSIRIGPSTGSPN